MQRRWTQASGTRASILFRGGSPTVGGASGGSCSDIGVCGTGEPKNVRDAHPIYLSQHRFDSQGGVLTGVVVMKVTSAL